MGVVLFLEGMHMQRFIGLVVVVVVLLGANRLPGQDEERKPLGKSRDQWIAILKKDKNVKLRRAALIILDVEFGPKERGVLSAITEALQKDDSAELRKEAAQILGRMAGDAKMAVLPLGEAATRDKAPEVRAAAARALGGPMAPHAKPALPLLVEGLKDADPAARAAIASTLKDLGTECHLIIPQIMTAIKDKDSDRFTQFYLIQLLSKFEDESTRIIPLFIDIVTQANAHPLVREAAIDGLHRLNAVTAPVQSALEQVLKDTKAPSSLRCSAAGLLTRIGGDARALWPTVKGLLTSTDKALKIQAIRLAGKLGKDEAEVIPALVARTSDEHLESRLAAIQELGLLGPLARDAEAVLVNIARNDTRGAVREAAAVAVKKIRGEEKEK